MYKNNFVMAIKVNNKVLREFDNVTYIPFGSEYSILLKNKSPDKRVRVYVHIDGQDALDGSGLIIDAKSEVDLKRFIKNGNLSSGNAFKFIEKTEKIEKFRGNKAEDGLITITYEFERKQYYQYIPPKIYYPHHNKYDPFTYGNVPDGWTTNVTYSSNVDQNSHPVKGTATTSMDYMSNERGICGSTIKSKSFSSSNVLRSANAIPQNTSGITAPGSITEQKFHVAYDFVGDGDKHTMTIELKGGTPEGRKVQKEVTVKKLIRCQMCGTHVKQTARFCHECGSSVTIV